MNKDEKTLVIDELATELASANVFYLADASGMNAGDTSTLRRKAFGSNITLKVVKNTLLKKAMEKTEGKDFSELYSALTGPTAIMYSEIGNAPAKLIADFRKKHDRPVLKAAYIEESIYVGDQNLQTLVEIKSKEELIGEIVALLQSPAKNVVSALQSGKNTIAGLVKTLSEKE